MAQGIVVPAQMNWNESLRTVALCALCSVAGWAFYQWGKAAPDLAPTLAAMNQSIARLNPVITNANTAFKNLADATGDWSDSSKAQARDVRALLSAGGRTLDAVTEDAHAGKAAIQSGQKAADGLTETFAQVNDKDVGVKATLAKVNGQLDALKAYEDSPEVQAELIDFAFTLKEVKRFTSNSADSMENVKGITADIHTETTKMTQPKTKEQKIMEWAPVAVKGTISVLCVVFGPC
jgi:hypothetical protein